MRLLFTSTVTAVFVGCVSQTQPGPEYASYDYGAEYAGVSSGPDDPRYGEATWQGPPGGPIDPGYGYLGQNGEPEVNEGVIEDPPADTSIATESGEWVATSEVTDAEIDVTLEGYGEWIEDADYGTVWRPYDTVVGTDFTPYESCGSFVATEFGWTFQSCDAWSWGWLPFHYGRWVNIDTSWAWVRDYTWGPAWVEWRHGGGYVGWRPLHPTQTYWRDRERDPRSVPDRRHPDADWRFERDTDFGGRPVPPSRGVRVRDGLHATTSVAQPPLRGERGRASSVMTGRVRDHHHSKIHTSGSAPTRNGRRTPNYDRAARPNATWNEPRPWNGSRTTRPSPYYDRYGRPTWNGPRTTPSPYDRAARPNAPTWNEPRPTRPAPYYDRAARPNAPTWNEPRPRAAYDRAVRPNAPTWNEPRPAYDRAARPNAPTWNEPRPPRPAYDRAARPNAPTWNEPRPTRPAYDRARPTTPTWNGPRPAPSSSTSSSTHPSPRSRPAPLMERVALVFPTADSLLTLGRFARRPPPVNGCPGGENGDRPL